MRKTICAVILLIAALPSLAQSERYDYGSSKELKGVTKFYIDAGEDIDLRNIIAERIGTVGMTAVERPEDAEHWIVFRWSGSGPFWTRMIVVKRTGDRQRLLATYRGTEADLDDLASDAGKALAKRLKDLDAAN